MHVYFLFLFCELYLACCSLPGLKPCDEVLLFSKIIKVVSANFFFSGIFMGIVSAFVGARQAELVKGKGRESTRVGPIDCIECVYYFSYIYIFGLHLHEWHGLPKLGAQICRQMK